MMSRLIEEDSIIYRFRFKKDSIILLLIKNNEEDDMMLLAV